MVFAEVVRIAQKAGLVKLGTLAIDGSWRPWSDSARREGKAAPKVRSELVETRAMQRKLRTARGRATYKKRKHLVEPVFGWIKQVLLPQFLTERLAQGQG